MSPEKAKELKPLNTAALKVLTEDDSEDAIVYINELLKLLTKPPTTKTFGSPRQMTLGTLLPTRRSKAEYCEK